MIEVTTKPIYIDLELKRKIEFVCNFCNITPTIINGSIRNIGLTNISYIEPPRIIIKGTFFLAFYYSNELYINGLGCKINKDYSFADDLTCANSTYASWLVNGQFWWTRSARPEHNMNIYVVGINGNFDHCTASFVMGIRPTIIISKEVLLES